jgi:hypothetical protein
MSQGENKEVRGERGREKLSKTERRNEERR